MKIKELFIYPLKSGSRILVKEHRFSEKGFDYDRAFSIIDNKRKVITAREEPRLLKIHCEVKGEEIVFNFEEHSVKFKLSGTGELLEVKLFRNKVKAYHLDANIDRWLSSILKNEVRLVANKKFIRNVEVKSPFMDDSPFHLVNENSIADLNKRVLKKVTEANFRPNIVISGIAAYKEDSWKKIKIGETIFEVLSKCPRCSMVTINYDDRIKNKEVLNKLSAYRKDGNNVNFGIYLRPLSKGILREGDRIEVIQ